MVAGTTCVVTLNGREVIVSRARLGRFLRLESIAYRMIEVVKDSDSGAVVSAIEEYLKLATNEDIGDLRKQEWFDFFSAFASIKAMNSLGVDLPFLRYPTSARGREEPWDYHGRVSIIWIHLLASTYHWALNTIEDMTPEEAAGYIQEILTDDQFEREWQHSLSEIAYSQDKKGKYTYHQLRRPNWMLRLRPKKIKILKKLIPSGNIIDLSGVTPDQLDE